MSRLIKTSAWLTVGVVLVSGVARADVKLPRIFGDHMVLQQNTEAAVWGWADAGEQVTVTLGEASATAETGDNGR